MTVPMRNSHLRMATPKRWVYLDRTFRAPRRRLWDLLANVLLGLGLVSVVLMVIALGLGSAWLIIVIVERLTGGVV